MYVLSLSSLKIQNPDLHLSGASGFMGFLGSFPFLFPSLVVKKTAETKFCHNFIVLHAGDVNQNGAILSPAFVIYGHRNESFFDFFQKEYLSAQNDVAQRPRFNGLRIDRGLPRPGCSVRWQQLAFVCDSFNKCRGTATFEHVRRIVVNPTRDSIAGLRPRKGAFFFMGRGTVCLASHTQIISQLANGLPMFGPVHP